MGKDSNLKEHSTQESINIGLNIKWGNFNNLCPFAFMQAHQKPYRLKETLLVSPISLIHIHVYIFHVLVENSRVFASPLIHPLTRDAVPHLLGEEPRHRQFCKQYHNHLLCMDKWCITKSVILAWGTFKVLLLQNPFSRNQMLVKGWRDRWNNELSQVRIQHFSFTSTCSIPTLFRDCCRQMTTAIEPWMYNSSLSPTPLLRQHMGRLFNSSTSLAKKR